VRTGPQAILRHAQSEGTHAQRGSARLVRYGAEYEVTGNTHPLSAPGSTAGDARRRVRLRSDRLDAAAAVDAFLQNHIEKADWTDAP
jgi:hypothetical protein